MRRSLGDPAVADEVVDRIVGRVVARARGPKGPKVDEVVSEGLYNERRRLRHSEAPLAESDREFDDDLRAELARRGAGVDDLLRRLVRRYASEVQGHFDETVYTLATRALPFALAGLLGGITPLRLAARTKALGRLPRLDDRLHIEGELDTLRSLAARGTVVLAPTHSSNLDSPLMGYAIYALGLPPFAYGAGLNLFSSKVLGYFMHNLGAYTVDREKTDPLYREVLKEYATVSIESGQHNLFFPGGTRSRSGAIETHVKKGLLGAALAAFRNNVAKRAPLPGVFIVPATITYPLVLEGESLARAYLEESGKGRYIARDESDEPRRWVDFLRDLMALDVEVHLRIGRPLDALGNDVGEDGVSRDARGRPVDAARYFLVDGDVVEDAARDAEYTRFAAARVVDTYKRDNTALPTAIVAFAALELARREIREKNLHRLLGRIGSEHAISRELLDAEVARALAEIAALEERGSLRLGAPPDAAAVVDAALRTFATYHRRAVLRAEDGAVRIGDPRLLFFYRNRLDGYGLLNAPSLLSAGTP